QISQQILFENNDLKANGDFSFVLFMAQRTDTGAITTDGNKDFVIKKNHIHDTVTGLLLDGDYFDVSENYFDHVNTPIACLKLRNSVFNKNIFIGFVGNGIALGNGSDDIIENIVISNNVLDGLLTSTVHGINVYKQGGDGNPTGSPNLGLSKYITIIGNTVKNAGATGIFAYANGNLTITGNVVTKNRGGGILVNTPASEHPGNLVITGNVAEENSGAGIAIAPTNTVNGVHHCVVSNNICTKNISDGRGIYLSKMHESIVSNNMCSQNEGEGLFSNGCKDTQIIGNRMTENKLGSPQFNGDFVLSATIDSLMVIKDNIASSFYNVTGNNPYISTGNVGIPNRDGLFVNEKCDNVSYSSDVTVNVPLFDVVSSNRSTLLIVSVIADRQGSNDFANHHQSCLGIVPIMWDYTNGQYFIGSISYLYQNGTDPKATITASLNADGSSVDISGHSNYVSTDEIVITVSPIKSPLILS
ncbi:MAG: Right handed beta helix region, partial [Neobacillus sp.]|nr:Right handed beta helix region [Neobacillus sp.]